MRQTRKSSLFLMELIIAILFFSLSAAVCVRLFAAAYLTSRESNYRDVAMLQAQSIAAMFCNADGDLTDVIAFTNALPGDDGQYVGSVVQDGVSYTAVLQPTASETLPALTIALIPENETEAVVTLQTKVYLQQQIGEGA